MYVLPATLGVTERSIMATVGSLDVPVIKLNRTALQHLHAKSELVIIPGASHLFEEAHTLDQVIVHATRWFVRHFKGD